MQVGPQAAETVLSRLAGRQPAPATVIFAGQCLSPGRRQGFFQFARRDDTPVGTHLGGRAGAKLKEFICRSIVWQLAFEARHPGRLRVPDGRRGSQPGAQNSVA
jgi:hypothetical protein